MLNLDDLLGEKKSIQWGGEEYPVNEPSLENVFEAQRILAATDEKEQLSGMAEIVKMLVPGLDVSKMPLRVLSPLFDYVINGAEKKTETPTETEVTDASK